MNSPMISVCAREIPHVRYVDIYCYFQGNLGSACYFTLERAAELGGHTDVTAL